MLPEQTTQRHVNLTSKQKVKKSEKKGQKTGGEMLQSAFSTFILAFVLIPGLHGALDCPTGNVNEISMVSIPFD